MNIERAICTGNGATYAYSNRTCRCEECRVRSNKAKRIKYSANPDYQLSLNKASYQRHRTQRLSDKLKSSYGITIEERDALFAKQGNLCAVCNRKAVHDERTFHVDHNHITGKVRGILCHHCNTALGLLKEDKQIILSLINYLEKEVYFEH